MSAPAVRIVTVHRGFGARAEAVAMVERLVRDRAPASATRGPGPAGAPTG